ncbi:EAL domain-containing protein, partial [Marinobacter sp.]|uniref:EAL domain-containing protein n=1 Tax=Marinobacter sp. TaxID=50741 RepID=UPI0035C6639F
INFSGSMDVNVEVTIQNHIQKEILKTINLKEIILGRVAARMNFDTKKLIFELTENERLNSLDHLVSIIDAYKEMGFATAIDDFGAGYSRYNLMIASPPDILKLDMGLIRGVHDNVNQQAVISGIIAMMKQLGGQIVAEGVETKQEYFFLRSQGITLFQGYLFAKPGFEYLPEPVFPV